MVTIIKGNEKIVCSYKTYDEQFRQLGYTLDSEKKETAKVVELPKEEKVTEEEKIGSKYGTRKRTSTKTKKEE